MEAASPESEIGVLVWSGFGESSVPALQTAAFLLWLQVEEKEQALWCLCLQGH